MCCSSTHSVVWCSWSDKLFVVWGVWTPLTICLSLTRTTFVSCILRVGKILWFKKSKSKTITRSQVVIPFKDSTGVPDEAYRATQTTRWDAYWSGWKEQLEDFIPSENRNGIWLNWYTFKGTPPVLCPNVISIFCWHCFGVHFLPSGGGSEMCWDSIVVFHC